MARSMFFELMLLVMIFNLSCSSWVYYAHGTPPPQVPCYFIFGASTFDNGNNNNLATTSKADYLPYRVDFPFGPTGRFCNGRTPSDFIAEFVGIRSYIPSFASTRRGLDLRILKGVNYASAGSGIRNETGRNLGDLVSTDGQLENHQEIVSRIAAILSDQAKAANYLHKCLYSVGTGTNDYINNYFRPQFFNTSRQFTPQQYAVVLVQQLSGQLTTLYKLGARKVALFGIPPVGCAPAVVAAAGGGTNGSSCVSGVNNAVQLFNLGLKGLVDTLNDNLTGAEFTFVNSFQISSTSTSGYRVTNAPCCQVSPVTALCISHTLPCRNRREYSWWDAIHPTEAANRVTATRAYRAQSESDTYPIDINTLVTRQAL